MSLLSASTPTRIVTSNNGRSFNNRQSNVEFVMYPSPVPSLLPSTCSARSINSSISNLARQHIVRGLHEINNIIIQTTTQKLALQHEGVTNDLIGAYTQKIADLQEECLQSIWLSHFFLDYEASSTVSTSIPPDLPTINDIDTSEIEDRRQHIRRR